jgi:hypothetical protein
MIAAKVLPVFDTLLPAINKDNTRDIRIGDINMTALAKALDLIDDKDMDKLIDIALQNTFEQLRAGLAPVINSNGAFGVMDMEDDPVITLRLVIESVAWALQGFFDGSRLTSILLPLGGLLLQEE